MIIIDFAGHMTSTESEEELHIFADKLGLKRSYYQEKGYDIDHPHYDLFGPRMVDKAIEMGAEEISPRELIKRSWWKK